MPSTVFRAKGMVHLVDRPEHRAVLHVVGQRAELNLRQLWGDKEPKTEIVVIGSGAAPEADALREAFVQCQVPDGLAPGPLGAILRWIRGT